MRHIIFIDFENLYISSISRVGIDKALKASQLVVDQYIHKVRSSGASILEILAYANWEYLTSKTPIQNTVGKMWKNAIKTISVPSEKGKGTADLTLALDAFETGLKWGEGAIICVMSGDRDFLPLVDKLRARAIPCQIVCDVKQMNPWYVETLQNMGCLVDLNPLNDAELSNFSYEEFATHTLNFIKERLLKREFEFSELSKLTLHIGPLTKYISELTGARPYSISSTILEGEKLGYWFREGTPEAPEELSALGINEEKFLSLIH